MKPTTCSICHGEQSCHPLATLNHPCADRQHVKTDCFGGHTGTAPVYHGTSKRCVDCHRKEYDRHHHGDVVTTCEGCHSTDSWKRATKSKKK